MNQLAEFGYGNLMSGEEWAAPKITRKKILEVVWRHLNSKLLCWTE